MTSNTENFLAYLQKIINFDNSTQINIKSTFTVHEYLIVDEYILLSNLIYIIIHIYIIYVYIIIHIYIYVYIYIYIYVYTYIYIYFFFFSNKP